jgi:hypothetical protein
MQSPCDDRTSDWRIERGPGTRPNETLDICEVVDQKVGVVIRGVQLLKLLPYQQRRDCMGKGTSIQMGDLACTSCRVVI